MATFAHTIDRASETLQTAQDVIDRTRGAFDLAGRVAAGAAGASLIIAGVRRSGFSGALMAVSGADLVYHSIRGEGHLYDLLLAPDKEGHAYGEGVKVRESIVVDRPANQLYRVWRDFENLPIFLSHIKDVERIDENRSRWTVQGPMRMSMHWDAEVIADREGELIGWRTVDGERVAHAGSVRFEPVEDDKSKTEVTVSLQFNPPAGRAGAAVSRLLGGDPQQAVHEDLQRFKGFAEAMDLDALNRLLERRRSAAGA